LRIGIVGGTGDLGRGLALRWSQDHKIIIGSRSLERAKQACRDCLRVLHDYDADGYIVAADNAGAVTDSDVVVLALHYPHLRDTVKPLARHMDEHVVISPVVPMFRTRDYSEPVTPDGESASVELAAIVPDGCHVVAALHTVPATRLAELDADIDVEVPVCGDDINSRRMVMQLVREIPATRAVDAGPLSAAGAIEERAPSVLGTGR